MTQLTSLQLIAGAYLANNSGIQLNSALSNNLSSYDSTTVIDSLKQVYSNIGVLDAATISSLTVLGANICPALSDTTPNAYAANIGLFFGNAALGNSTQGFSGLVANVGNTFLGNGDDSIFTQIFSSAQGYIISTNNYILSTKNSNSWLSQSFTNMNNLITGSLSEVNLAFSAFGSDLARCGQLINLANIDNFGSPLALCQQLDNIAAVTPTINFGLSAAGYDIDVVTNPPTTLQAYLQLEKTLYEIFTQIKGTDLAQVLDILDVTTANITTMADLLNIIKIFPNSYSSLTVKTVEGLRGLYIPGTQTINSLLKTELPSYVLERFAELSVAIPADQALACQSFRASLLQIKNIKNISLPQLAAAFSSCETTRDLPLINDLTEPVPQSVIDYYSNTFETGSGVDGTLVIGDVIGVSAGFNFTDSFANTTSIIDTMTNAGSLANLITVYNRMANTVSGVYGDPTVGPVVIPSGIAAGTYTNGNDAFNTGLLPNAQSIITTVVSTNPSQTSQLNSLWVNMAANLVNQIDNVISANIDIGNLIANQRSSVLSFVSDLPSFGVDTQKFGTREYIESIADLSSLGGQAIIGCMREGKNNLLLSELGIGIDLTVPSVPTQAPIQANLLPSNYTESQAANLVIT
jgi:hypothetical protein